MAMTKSAVGMTDVPIIIYAFDRPHYLDRVCAGLVGQRHLRADPSRVHLLQDGAVSKRTGHQHGRPGLIARSIEVFRHHFPEGHVHAAPDNIGIAENVLRGQTLVFETLDAPVGYFFEDDLEPGPHYLAALEAVRRATEPFADRVGLFAAYGDHRSQPPGPQVGYRALDHHWAFGLRRDAWRRIQASLAPWWEEIRRNDYRARNDLRLLKFWHGRSVAKVATSQDAAAELACAELGLARVNTDVCFGRYIGMAGEHFTPALFRRLGFDGASWADGDDFTFGELTEPMVERLATRARAFHEAFRRDELEPHIARMEATRDDPDRFATEAEIAALWHLLLDRREVPPEVMARHAGRTTIRDLRREIVRMRPFRHSTGP